MENKERKLRLREEVRGNILDAALILARDGGWQAVSMRKIADMISHTAPVIYDYFRNKEDLLTELGRTGFLRLSLRISAAQQKSDHPLQQLEDMWMAYWEFANEEKVFYQLMFGVGMQGCSSSGCPAGMERSGVLLQRVIRELMPGEDVTEEQVTSKYFLLWALVHGVISLHQVHKEQQEEFNRQLIQDAIRSIIGSPVTVE